MSSSLHTHSYFSVLDGYSSPEENLKRASELGLKGLAITEHGEVTSWLYYAKAAEKYPDIKILYGVELYECANREIQDKNNKYWHLIAIAKNDKGRIALNKIVSLGQLHGFYYKPRVTIYDVAPYADDLIILSACLASKLSRTEDYNQCLEYIREYKSLFPNYFLEIQAHDNEVQEKYNKKIIQLAKDTDTKVVVTNDVHAATKEDLYYQSYYLRIAHDKETESEVYEGCYLMSNEEIHEVLDKQIGYDTTEECIRNTDLVTDICEVVQQPFGDPELPEIDVPDGFDSTNEYLHSLIREGWYKRGMDSWDEDKKAIYKKRIEDELYVIETKDFVSYFLIIYDYINWCRQNNVIVGPGRGSAAGSLVLYLMYITNLDPIKYELDFGRFLTILRKDLPDVDVDISDRAKVIDYLTKKYGEDKVVQVMNIVYTTPVTSIRDIGKILGFPYSEMEAVSKTFVQDTWEDCLKANESVAKNPKYKELLDIAGHISNRPRGYGIHAGGVIIARHDIYNYLAMRRGQNGEHVISCDKHLCEEIHLVKLDVLAVQSLVVINEVQQDAGISDWELDINNPEFENDQAMYDMICSGRTSGLFQIESQGMIDLISKLQPRSLNECAALVALYRPDAMPAIDGYIDGKKNKDHIHYIHPDMAQILDDTFGQNIYQEQSMRMTKVFGGRDDAGADRIRKCLAKKIPEKVKEEVDVLYKEILDNGYDKKVAESICSELREKGGYGFNRSHAACYGYICMQTAYLKAHYPAFFFKALFNLNKNKPGKLNKYIIDAHSFNVKVLPPNINNSQVNFSVVDNKILFGLSAITSIGETFADQIISERNTNGKFKNFDDFVTRINPSKSQIIALVKSGAIPTNNKKQFLINYFKSQYGSREYKPVTSLPTKYKLLLDWNINTEDYKVGKRVDKEAVLKLYNEKRKEIFDQEQETKYQEYIKECNEKYLADEQYWEFETLQFFVSDENPFEEAYKILPDFDEIEVGDKCVVVGVISKIQKKKTKKGQQYAYINLYGTSLLECTVWPDALKKFGDLIVKGQQIAILCKKDGDDKVIVDKIKPYNEWLTSIKSRRKIH